MGKIKDILQHSDEICQRFVKPGAFLVSGNAEENNIMTIGWGFLGYAWGLPACAVMVRNSRYTQALMDKHSEFVVCLPFDGMNAELGKAGSCSGRDQDKWAACGLEQAKARAVSTPVATMKSGLVVECRTVASTHLQDGFVHLDVQSSSYIHGDLHKLYFGEILEAY